MSNQASVQATSTGILQTRSSLTNRTLVLTVRARIWTGELQQLAVSALMVRLQESLSTVELSRAEIIMTPTRRRSFAEMTTSLLNDVEETAQNH